MSLFISFGSYCLYLGQNVLEVDNTLKKKAYQDQMCHSCDTIIYSYVQAASPSYCGGVCYW